MTTISQDSTTANETEQNRLRIIGAAIGAFSKRGFPESSMEDIVRESGVAPEVAYDLFPGKYDVLKVLGDLNKMAATGMLDGVTKESPLPPTDEIVARVADFFESMAESGAPAGIAPQAMGLALYDEEVNVIIQDVFAALRASWDALAVRMAAEGRLPEGTEPEDVGATLLTVALGFMSHSMIGGVNAGSLRRGLHAVLA